MNAPTTTRDVLDDDVGLDRRAADGLILHRNGPDGIYGTADDDLFDTLAEVDDVRWVGDVTLGKLLDYAAAHDWVPGGQELLGVFEGVPFTVEEAEMTLSVVNTATERQLDVDADLNVRAVQSIIAARPIYSMIELERLAFVGPAALEQLKEYSNEFLDQDLGDGSFVLTSRLAVYYLDVMVTVLYDDREFIEEISTLAAVEANDVDRILTFIEDELEREIDSRVGNVYPSEQDLLDELFDLLERLQTRSRDLLLN